MERNYEHRPDYLLKWGKVGSYFGLMADQVDNLLVEWYDGQKMSAQEISDSIFSKAKVLISARTIQRILKQRGVIRSGGDAFRLKASQGKVKWSYKSHKIKRISLNPKLRYSILKRDSFKCVLCGVGANMAVLEMDHIVPVSQGGKNLEHNLRTLCHHCNEGKRIVDKEK